MDTKEYWHFVPREEKQKILNSHIKGSEFVEKYKQPDWCGIPDGKGLDFLAGCWSLIYGGKEKEDDCKGCEFWRESEFYTGWPGSWEGCLYKNIRSGPSRF